MILLLAGALESLNVESSTAAVSIESGGSDIDDATFYLLLKHNTKSLIPLLLLLHMHGVTSHEQKNMVSNLDLRLLELF